MKAKILIVDDNVSFVKITAKLLQRHGYEVLEANDGPIGLELAKKEKPDIVLLDVVLPGMGGFDVCRILKESVETKFTPVIMFTEVMTKWISKITGLKAGVDGYLTKPVNINELLIRIEKLLEKKKDYVSTHPLTHLPGSATIEREIREKLNRGEKFSVCHLDIDSFKSYNTIYGYIKGDDVIKFLREILLKVKNNFDTALEDSIFVGHTGGDNFIFTSPVEVVEKVCGQVIKEFDEHSKEFYSEEDAKRQHIMSISIAEVNNKSRDIQNYAQIIEILARVGDHLKALPGRKNSMLMMDQSGSETKKDTEGVQ
ncbi:response regulator [Elusimicrobiota bacterium]